MRPTIPCVLAIASVATLAHAGDTPAFMPRSVQIRSIDFDAGLIELHNFAAFDIDLSGWRFCTHDFNEARRYSGSSGLNGVTIEAGTSVFIHFNNDAPPADPDRLNRSTVGTFATPLDQDAYGMQLFNTPEGGGGISFSNSALIADHLQWNINGEGTGASETRTAQAVGQSLWSANGDFIATATNSDSITLTDLTGGLDHSPADYDVETPVVNTCVSDVNNDGVVDIIDFGVFGNAFGSSLGEPNYNADVDFNEDDVVDIIDFGVFGMEFGREDC